ncbi:hypothetical protein [Asanoa iriomotensis]|uniref:Uncharacterized protein n=1 Tax=Asanoa iriomotensis TaxID=234613 RepID=A0ABQ4CFI1_9ACTN|nr:hypothetical protein [Asanoa iriomotensis]GIF61531.1 hypothetical protein Air01nite_76260 [Asanoa iriomotensis]
MNYRYFVSYMFRDYNGFGYGSCDINLALPIRNRDDIAVVTDLLRNNNIDNPNVIAFSRYDDGNPR